MNKKISPNVAVLLPTFNGSKFIDKQIISILEQRKVSLTLLIYDDDSNDDTFTKASSYGSVKTEHISSLPYFSSKKSAANSFYRIIAGVNLDPKYEFIAFSDQDDIWFSKKISRAIDLIKDSNFSGYSSSVVAYWQDGTNKYYKKGGLVSKFNSLYESAGPGCTYVISRELFNAFRYFLIKNKEIFEKIDFHDWAIYSFAMNNNFKWFIDPKPSMYYRQHEANSFGARSSFNQYLKRLKLIFRGWYFSQVYLLYKVYLPESFIIRNPKLLFFHRIYFFFMIISHRRNFLDKFSLSFLSLFSSLKNYDK